MNRNISVGVVVGVLFLIPSVSFAASLTTSQINSIIQLLIAFNVDSATLSSVEHALEPSTPIQVAPAVAASPVQEYQTPAPSLQQIANEVAQKDTAASQQALSTYLSKRQQVEDKVRKEVTQSGGIATESDVEAIIASKLQQDGLAVPPSTATFSGSVYCNYIATANATYRCSDGSGLFTTNVTVFADGSLRMSTY
ncbi:MAG: hypothetical protein ACYC1Y_00005 [Minisyncoccota bacterium]